jgi:hypothetical protein
MAHDFGHLIAILIGITVSTIFIGTAIYIVWPAIGHAISNIHI